MVYNLSVILVVAIVIIIVVVVVCVKKGTCSKNAVGVRPTGEIASNYHPPPPALIPTAGQHPNPFPPIFTVPIPRQASCQGYPYPQPANYKNSRLPPINRVT